MESGGGGDLKVVFLLLVGDFFFFRVLGGLDSKNHGYLVSFFLASGMTWP